MKNKKFNIVLLILMIILVLYFTLKDDLNGILGVLKSVNIFIFILALLIFLISLFFKSLSLYIFIKEYDENYKIRNAFSLTLISQFLNGITPFQSGGQPFEIYLLKKRNIRISDSTNALLKDFISFQIALILVGLFSILINLNTNIIKIDSYLVWIILLGFIINFIVLLFILIFVNAKNWGKKILNKLINFIFKFKFMKRFEDKKNKLIDSINHFYETSDTIKNSKKEIFKGVIYNIIYLVLLYLIPLLIFNSLGFYNITILNSLVVTSFVMLIGNFIPIPGATGGIEYGFIQLFKPIVSGFILPSGMLLWRAITYFIAMIIGAITLIFERRINN